jgi:hypothetical protein
MSKTEKRIYIVSETNMDGEPYSFTKDDIFAMNDEEFIEEAEAQGYVYSDWEYIQASFNCGELPDSKTSVMRVIEVEVFE